MPHFIANSNYMCSIA